jgi:predicted permease
MSTIAQDVRYALRLFARRPGSTAVAIATVAVSIGVNVTIFSILNRTLLQQPPFPRPDEVVRVFERAGQPSSVPNFIDLREGSRDQFVALATWSYPAQTLLGGPDDASRVMVVNVTPEIFDVMGVPPFMGRALTNDDVVTNAPAVVISYALWRGRLGADPNVLGRELRLNGQPSTVVGVLADGIALPAADVWRPLIFTPQLLASRRGYFLQSAGRLRPGVSRDQAAAVLTGIIARVDPENGKEPAAVILLHDQENAQIRTPLLFAQVIALLVLLIAGVNVTNLLLASFSSRHTELAVRASLGAGRVRLMRQLVVESVVLTGAGGLAGAVLAFWLAPLLAKTWPVTVPRLDAIGVGWPEIGVALALAVVTGVAVSLLPAFFESRAGIGTSLKTATSTPSRATRTLRHALIVVEVALALMLLTGAGLLIRSLAVLTGRPLGQNPAQVLTMDVSPPQDRYSTADRQREFFLTLFDRLNADARVVAASGSNALPFSGRDVGGFYTTDAGEQIRARTRVVTPRYLEALDVPLVRGRFFTSSDTAESPAVVVVNEAFAREYGKTRDVIGLHLKRTTDMEIVGVIGDTRPGFYQPAQAEAFRPLAQNSAGYLRLAVRTRGTPSSFVPALRRIIGEVEPTLAMRTVDTMSSAIDASVATPRFNMTLLSAIAALAAGLAAVGIFGVTTYVVGLRVREIGIRLALGARAEQVKLLVVRQGAGPILVGLTTGLGGAWMLTGVLKSELVDTTPHDPWVLTTATAAFLAIGLLACWLPARRTTRVDPVSVLKAD